ncbi:hypothetical protein [Pseudoroseomonas cervicalis]|uniref:hypothetical protein n=1 Tax=Teichococcus cervicalis TaxID=204525 RepID=UPI0027803C39|nr:hypothetical protein [Pseudoroseomonas cervicalis]MDQ1077542.1 hypothetical protein [Pseudoroseomonas cervicalis]
MRNRGAALALPPALLLALAGGPALAQPAAPAAGPAPAAPAAAAAPAAEAAPMVRVRTGQHADRGRVVLNLGRIPAHSLRRVGDGVELRLQGAYRLDLSELRRITELAGIEAVQEGEETVLRLRPGCDCNAELGQSGGALYVDLRRPPAPPRERPVAAAAAANAAPPLAEARRRLIEDAVRLGLMGREQAEAMLRQAPAAAPAAPPAPAAAPAPRGQAAQGQASQGQAAHGQAGHGQAAARDDLGALREAMLGRLALLNGAAPPPGSAAAGGAAGGAPAAPPQAAPQAAAAPPRPPCTEAPFSLAGWTAGPGDFIAGLARRRGELALSDQGTAELAGLAEYYAGHELAREALELLATPLAEAAVPEQRARLDRARDLARLLLRQRLDPASPLLAEAADCARPDLPLWRGLAAALQGDAAGLARLAPQIRAQLREVPPGLRIAFVHIMADAVEEDAETLRSLVAVLRTMPELRPDQEVVRSWLMARLARLENNRADETTHLERAARGGRSLPAMLAQARLASLNFGRPGAEGSRAEALLLDLSRTYRHDSLGEEAAMLYGQKLLERGDLGAALAVADGASQASQRPSTESRGARLAAQALRLLLVDAKGLALPSPGERLALYWQYEGYATPGERGDDIRRGAAQLMLEQGLADAALETVQALSPATAQQPEGALLLARAEAASAQGDPQRALALLRQLPPGEAVQRAAAAALARLGRPLEAAQELQGLRELPDRSARAGLLFQAQAWPDAMAAYAELLRDPGLDPAARAEATARLASAAALARQRPGVPGELLAPEGGAAALLQLSGGAPPTERGVPALRSAISRSRQVEQLLPAAAPRQGP